MALILEAGCGPKVGLVDEALGEQMAVTPAAGTDFDDSESMDTDCEPVDLLTAAGSERLH